MKYKLKDLMDQCDPSADFTDEELAWLNLKPVGLEDVFNIDKAIHVMAYLLLKLKSLTINEMVNYINMIELESIRQFNKPMIWGSGDFAREFIDNNGFMIRDNDVVYLRPSITEKDLGLLSTNNKLVIDKVISDGYSYDKITPATINNIKTLKGSLKCLQTL